MMRVFVYLMGNEQLKWFKIGISDKPIRRLHQLNLPFELKLLAAFPTKNRNHALLIESRLHQKHKSQHVRREWFTGDLEKVAQEFLAECVEFALVASENRSRTLELKLAERLTADDAERFGLAWQAENREQRKLRRMVA